MSPTIQQFPRPGADGMVAAFSVAENKWKRVALVDAREMLNIGTINFHGPKVKMVNADGARQTVHQVGVASAQAEGFQIEDGQDIPSMRGVVKEVIDPKLPAKPEGAPDRAPGAPVPQEVPEVSGGEDQGPSDRAQGINFNDYTVEQLREFVTQAGIEGTSDMRKAQLVAALDDADFLPKG